MADFMLDDDDSSVRQPTRPSLAQVRALVEFIQKHPDLAHRKLRSGVARQKVKKLWIQASNITNAVEGTLKTTKGWIKFWSDKRRSIILKQKQIDDGKITDKLSPIEQQIYDLCENLPNDKITKRKKSVNSVKVEPFNGDDEDSMEDLFPDTEELDLNHIDSSSRLPTEAEERQFNMMEKMMDVMNQQAQAMAQLAQASHNNSKALERLAEASHIQALAVDRVACSFENINSSVHDLRNAIVSIDYTMKRCYSTTATQQRQTNLFS